MANSFPVATFALPSSPYSKPASIQGPIHEHPAEDVIATRSKRSLFAPISVASFHAPNLTDSCSFKSPEIIGHYLLGKSIGEGAFAKVYTAVHTLTGMQVAIKVINKKKINDKYVAEHLQREGTLMRRLQHRHIIQLYEIVDTEQYYCVITELASGGEVLLSFSA